MKRLAELDSENGGVKESVSVVNEPTLAVITESVAECGMGMAETPAMGGMMGGMPASPSTPASFSINASASTGDEVANMLTQILTLSGMKEVTPKDIGAEMPGHPLTGEPPEAPNDIKAALDAIDQAEQPSGDVAGMPGELDTAGGMGTTGGDVGAMADQVQDMADQLKGTSKDELGLESLRQFDNSPQEHTRSYNPNDFANIINKVRDFETVPARGGDNPLKQESIEQAPAKDDSILNLTTELYKAYDAFKNS